MGCNVSIVSIYDGFLVGVSGGIIGCLCEDKIVDVDGLYVESAQGYLLGVVGLMVEISVDCNVALFR